MKKVYLIDRWTNSAIREGLNNLISVSMVLGGDGGYTIEYLSSRSGINEDICKDLMGFLCHMGIYNKIGDYYEPKYVTYQDLVRKDKEGLKSS